MGWFDSTSAILGVKGLEQQKKNDRWSKLMDIASVLQNTAGLGADIWKTVSGRKHDFALASVGNTYDVDTREDTQAHDFAMASASQGYAKEQFDWRSTFDAGEAEKERGWQEGQNKLNRELDERIATLDRAAQTQGRSEERTSFLAEWAQRAYELAVSNPSLLRPDGVFDPAKRETLRKFLYTQVDKLPNLSADEIAWVKGSFDGFVDALGSTTSGPNADAGKVTPAPSKMDMINVAKDTISKLRSMTLPVGIEKQVDTLEAELSSADKPPSAGHGVTNVQELLSRLTTLYNSYKFNSRQGGSGALTDDLRIIK